MYFFLKIKIFYRCFFLFFRKIFSTRKQTLNKNICKDQIFFLYIKNKVLVKNPFNESDSASMHFCLIAILAKIIINPMSLKLTVPL